MALFNYIMRKVWYHHTRIGLSLYDVIGQGYLREVVSFKILFTIQDDHSSCIKAHTSLVSFFNILETFPGIKLSGA